jgi:hypothetical protein
MSMLMLKLLDKEGPSLRGMVHDGRNMWAVFDFINYSCEKSSDDTYGRTNFYRLTKEGSKYKDEIESLCTYLTFPGEKIIMCLSMVTFVDCI